MTSDTVVLDEFEEKASPLRLRKKEEINVWIPDDTDTDDPIPAEK